MSIADFILPAAFVLDLMVGDPRWLPHPVRWMGTAIERLEPLFRKRINDPVWSGTLFAGCLVVGAWALVWLAVRLVWAVHPFLGAALEIVLVFYCISVRSLWEAARNVHRTLEQGSLEAARRAVSWIVGRDTRSLDRSGVSRAAVETVAENLVDGVISPLFFAALGGAPLAMAFKMVSTLDSMIGYKNDTYRLFGRTAARMDDAANFLPARLSVPVIAVAAQILFGSGRSALATAGRDGRAHTSPNAGIPEAAFAGALDVVLGGPNIYHGALVVKPTIGDGARSVQSVHITRACRLMALSALIWTALLWGIRMLVPVG